ncbi:DNA polymerase III subunit gamma/tau [bacterium]|nr:DNA polymerase III subunit gamma/tau [bacterium]
MFEGFADTDLSSSNREYQVLARRTRPQSFAELVGQESAVKAIEGMVSSGRIPHAFLFTGTRGTGKTSSARILAKSLCCEQGPTLYPCQTCTHCVQITACAHEDVFEIDGASHTGVDNVRELRESARFFPQSSRYKIFIIDEVHMLSIGAFNALLKTLEEPPPQVIFILATTELHKVPVTVRSRCMILSFRKIDPTTIAKHLGTLLEKDGITYDQDALQLVAREAKGSLRDSLSLLEQVLALGSHRAVTFESAKAALSVMGEGICQNLFEGILSRDPDGCLQAIAEADASSLDFSNILEQTANLFRSAIVLKQAKQTAGGESRTSEILNLLPAEKEFISRLAEPSSLVALMEIYRALAHASRDILRTNSQRAWAEITIMDCISRSEWLSSDDLSHLLAHVAGAGSTAVSQVSQASPSPVAAKSQNHGASNAAPAAARSPKIDSKPVGPETPTTVQSSTSSPTPDGLLDLFAQLISHIQGKNLQLAVKLKHAKLAQFTKSKISFTDCAENKLFAQLSESEADIFLSALQALGCSDCTIEGIELPKKYAFKQQQVPKASATPETASLRPQPDTSAPAVKGTPGQAPTAGAAQTRATGKTMEALASLSSNDPFGPKTTKLADQKKNEPLKLQRSSEGVSLAAVEQAEEAKRWHAKQAELRARPLLKKLEALGADIELVPLRPSDSGI